MLFECFRNPRVLKTLNVMDMNPFRSATLSVVHAALYFVSCAQTVAHGIFGNAGARMATGRRAAALAAAAGGRGAAFGATRGGATQGRPS